MKDYKQEAKDMAAAKLKKLGGKRSEHTESFMKRADGGRICKADGGPMGDEFDSGEEMDGEMSKPRLDKPGRGGGKTTVNIIVGKGPDAPGAPMAAMPPPPAPMPAPANLPPPPGGPMGGMPMRAKGGRVHRADGGWTGEGDTGQKMRDNAEAARKSGAGNRGSAIFNGGVATALATAMKGSKMGKALFGANAALGAHSAANALSDYKKAEEADKLADKAEGRAKGGRIHMTAGAESGEGRLEKAAMARRRKD